MIKRFSEFINEGWAADSMKRVSGRNLRKEDIPNTKEELQDIIIKRIESEGNECDLNDIYVSRIKDMSDLFNASENNIFNDFNGDISEWDVSGVTNMDLMFHHCKNFNGDISGWNVSNVKNMYGMFWGCEKFNQDIGGWNVSDVNTMSHMLCGCKNFNQDLSGWDVSGVKYMSNMFLECEKFNRDISGWDVSGVKNMICMFSGCTGFYEADKLDAWKDILRDDVNIEDMFKACPSRPSWYKE